MVRRTPRHRRMVFGIGVLAIALTFGGSFSATVGAQSLGDDYFTQVLGDPMDFGNQEDLVTNVVDEAPFVGASNKSIADGQLHFDVSGNFAADLVWPGFPTGIAQGRDGARNLIDTGTYRRLVLRMKAPAGSGMGVRWYNCKIQPSCEGGRGFVAVDGWQTYDLDLGTQLDPRVAMPWSGNMMGLRLAGNVQGHVDIDWVQLVGANTQVVSERTGSFEGDIRPIDKLDFATAAGDPWDMNSAHDVAERTGLLPGSVVAGNRFSGCTLGTSTRHFPGLILNMPNGKAIDAGRFKTLTFEYSYQGPFSSRPTIDGGTFARVFWFDAAGRRHPTNAIHLYPNQSVVQVRLDDPSALFQGIERGVGPTGAPWAGQVTSFRINPNDTKGSRCFTIGRVWLTSDDPAGTVVDLPSNPKVLSKPVSPASAAESTGLKPAAFAKKPAPRPVVRVGPKRMKKLKIVRSTNSKKRTASSTRLVRQ
jgi:hypothetical protein